MINMAGNARSEDTVMKILDVLDKATILVDLKAQDKIGILNELVVPTARITGIDPNEMVRVLMERERLGSTGIGDGIGIPHGKLKKLDRLILGFGLSRRGVDFESIDGRPTHLFFLLITPEHATDLHLKLLARVSRMLKKESLKQRLMNVHDADEVIAIISEDDDDF
ncbi:putative PTS IIA-like nitrogen-regulatory protein PtsN [Desulfosarcina cetonica]|uniref:PTS sugar transporter subunit IIA n=1 Tax=Desulfosarcina cetonica TaxID=90730 RepID=UPI000AD2CB64|nr:PTS sugar transporter subunit IIA [Desulfosarcina cetonica]VTR64745.1 putative PTS IIA-like nitrogen-regulatory protein PtsN [Desulfosarcina cetonica]